MVGAFVQIGVYASNNEAEYEALLAGLKAVSSLGARDVEIYSDSRLNVQGSFKGRDRQMKAYLKLAKQAISNFCMVKVIQAALAQNRHTDSLATLASSIVEEIPQLIKVELVLEPSIRWQEMWGLQGAKSQQLQQLGRAGWIPLLTS